MRDYFNDTRVNIAAKNMGGCVGKPYNKVNPPASEQFINEEQKSDNHSKNHSEGTILGINRTKGKDTSIDRENENQKSSEVAVNNDDKTLNENTMKTCSVVTVKHEGSGEMAISSQVKAALPRKAVRFDIDFNDMEVTSQSTPRIFPRRLKKLEGMPQLTAEQLSQKQELAEQNRAKELKRKTETLSKHNRDLFQAREYERAKNAKIQMKQKFLTNERNRQNHMKEVINKQQERERKAKNVRSKLYVELEGSIVHVDETYSSDGNSQDEDWNGEQHDKRSGTQADDSTDEFYESSAGPYHREKVW